MRSAPYQEVLSSTMEPGEQDWQAIPITEGLINHTYKITIKSSNKEFILQKINDHVFNEPYKLVSNYEKIWKQLQLMYVKLPEPLPFPDGSLLYADSRDQYWRKFEYIDKSVTVQQPSSIEQASAVAEVFATITASFDEQVINSIEPVLDGFHDLALRYRQFENSISMKNSERLLQSATLIREIKKREHYVSFYEVIIGSPEFKKRLMHHDAKISNVLFDRLSGEVICAVDLDTCMPGYFFSDIGDMIRSMVSDLAESATHGQVEIQKEMYEAIITSYLRILDKELTLSEKKYIHSAGLLMIYMQAIRFLTDYLQGDLYYQTNYTEQNLDRARNQVALLNELELFLQKEFSFRI